MRNSSTNS